MKLIKPKQISGEIMTLFDEADKKVIVVSPFYKIGKWHKLLNSLQQLKNREKEIEFYVRAGETDSINEIKQQGFTPICIPNLHTKLYMNEKYAIVSSMNLNISSDTNSLDIALKTQTEEEYKEINEYYERYILVNKAGSVTELKSGVSKPEQPVVKPEQKAQPQSVHPGSMPSLQDFMINESGIDWANWKETVVAAIKSKMGYKWAGSYAHQAAVVFKTQSANFECFFASAGNSNRFITKFSCSGIFFQAIEKNSSYLQKTTGCEIHFEKTSNEQYEVFINNGNPVKSYDFGFVEYTDITAILFTISCTLYILSFAEEIVNIKNKANSRTF